MRDSSIRMSCVVPLPEAAHHALQYTLTAATYQGQCIRLIHPDRIELPTAYTSV